MMRRAVLLIAACGGGGSSNDGIDVSSLIYKPCDIANHVGGFDIVLGDGFTAVQGQVFDAVTPSRVVETIASMGDCAWVRSPALICNPACTCGQICGPASTCIASPVAQDIGTVTVTGLEAEVTLAPRAPAFFYSFTGTLPHPGFEPGAGIRLDAPDLTLLGWGIEPLVVGATMMTVQSGSPVALTWTPPTGSGPAKVEVSLNVNGHGLVGSHIECVVDDTGRFTIPAPLVTSLLGDGLSGFPTLTLRRTTTDSTTTVNGCLELDVESAITLDVIIPGLDSCEGDEDCAPPETCQPDLTCG